MEATSAEPSLTASMLLTCPPVVTTDPRHGAPADRKAPSRLIQPDRLSEALTAATLPVISASGAASRATMTVE